MPAPATQTDLQSLCEAGQQQLMLMDYLRATSTFLQAEKLALQLEDFETLSRLYMPLQEARRQQRQRCGEGMVQLRLLANSPEDSALDAARLIQQYPQGQLLIAGWGTIAPACAFRDLQAKMGLYVETYLAATYPALSPDDPRLVAIVPLDDAVMPAPIPRPVDELVSLLPPRAILLSEDKLPESHIGDSTTYAWTMNLWERLHAPFLLSADNQSDLTQKMAGYRQAIAVDYACELAHQKLSEAARSYARLRHSPADAATSSSGR